MFNPFKKQPPLPPRRTGEAGTPREPAPVVTDQFRRNRTMSSYRSSQPEESSRHKAHHLAVQRRKAGGLFVLTVSIIIFLGLLLWQLIAQVRVVTSTKPLSASFSGQAYEKAINDYLAVNPAQRLRFTLDSSALSESVSTALPEVESLTLKKGISGIAQGSFNVTFRVPVAGWQINGNQYYVDAEGVVFEKNYYQAPSVQIVDESGITPEQGTAIASSRLLGFIGKAVASAKGRGYTVTKAVLPQNTTRTIELTFEGINTRARLVIDRGVGEQLEDFDRSYQYLKTNNISSDYIDVRISGRAAYK